MTWIWKALSSSREYVTAAAGGWSSFPSFFPQPRKIGFQSRCSVSYYAQTLEEIYPRDFLLGQGRVVKHPLRLPYSKLRRHPPPTKFSGSDTADLIEVDISRIDHFGSDHLVDREQELALIDDARKKDGRGEVARALILTRRRDRRHGLVILRLMALFDRPTTERPDRCGQRTQDHRKNGTTAGRAGRHQAQCPPGRGWLTANPWTPPYCGSTLPSS